MQQADSIGRLIAQGRQQLRAGDSAALDAEVLLAFVLGVDRAWCYAHSDDPVRANLACDYRSLLGKRAAGFPISYLTGCKEFWSMELKVDRHTLIPRPETECLVETALELIPERAALDVLDLGTGSGAIAVAVAKERPRCRVTAVDIMAETLAVARDNAARHGLSYIRFLQSDWFEALPGDVFDIILCNPPYVASGYRGLAEDEIRHEPRIALDGGYQGLAAIRQLIPASLRHIKPGGYLVLEHGGDQTRSVRELLVVNHFSGCGTRRDYAGRDRVSYARR
jgi:release factor glutamine methyltransferase